MSRKKNQKKPMVRPSSLIAQLKWLLVSSGMNRKNVTTDPVVVSKYPKKGRVKYHDR